MVPSVTRYRSVSAVAPMTESLTNEKAEPITFWAAPMIICALRNEAVRDCCFPFVWSIPWLYFWRSLSSSLKPRSVTNSRTINAFPLSLPSLQLQLRAADFWPPPCHTRHAQYLSRSTYPKQRRPSSLHRKSTPPAIPAGECFFHAKFAISDIRPQAPHLAFQRLQFPGFFAQCPLVRFGGEGCMDFPANTAHHFAEKIRVVDLQDKKDERIEREKPL